ncbi:MAG TPA: penicillin-binding protein 1B [Arenicellales bacterium]|nr:penicillin-binding protein 1B [Arenicellales bacterium]
MAAKKKKKTTRKPRAGKSRSRKTRAGTSRRGRGRRARRSSKSVGGPAFWLQRIGVLALLALVVYVVYLDFSVRKQMEGRRWALPATVYTQPLELYAGKAMSAERLERALKKLGYRRNAALEQPGTYTATAGAVRMHTRAFRFEDARVPSRNLDVNFSAGRIASIRNARGESVAIARIEPRRIGLVSPTRREDRKLIELGQVPDHLVAALLAAEDRNFTDHFGVDPMGLARAMWENIKALDIVQGGSTITQQLVKNFYLTSEQTLSRKLNEMIMAILLELHYDKREILETYLNEVYLGQSGNSAIHGVGLASLFYFNRPLAELEMHQTALLVAMVKGASYYNPRNHPERARRRRDLVIGQMEELGYLDAAEAEATRSRPLDVAANGVTSATVYPAFMGLMRRQLQDDYRSEDLNTEGLRIFTTLDPEIQAVVETAAGTRLQALEARRDMEPGTLNAAVVIARVESGEVVALLGGRNARYSGFNRAIDAERPVGSVIKPAVYLAALEASSQFNLATVLEDEPLTVEQRGAPDWSPENYSKKYYGDTLLIDALAHSRNVSTARLGLAVGVERVVDMIHRLGVSRKIPHYPSVMLGAVELAPVDVAQIYLTIANNGFRTTLRTTRSILSNNDEPLNRYPIEVRQAVEPGVVALLHYGLQEVIRSGTGKALSGRFEPGLGLAGKTGTTDGFRDSWFAGYSGNYVAVVWIGRDDNQPTGLSGASGAMLLWADIMEKLDLAPTYPVQRDRIRFVRVDDRGRNAEGCINGRRLPFIEGTVPRNRAPCAITSLQ